MGVESLRSVYGASCATLCPARRQCLEGYDLTPTENCPKGPGFFVGEIAEEVHVYPDGTAAVAESPRQPLSLGDVVCRSLEVNNNLDNLIAAGNK